MQRHGAARPLAPGRSSPLTPLAARRNPGSRSAPAATLGRCLPSCRPGDPGLRAQRGRLRGARRPAERGGWTLVDDAGRAPTWSRQHLRLRRGGEEGLDRRAARAPSDRGATGRRRRLPGRALRRRARRARCPRPTPCSASTTTRRSPTGSTTSLGRRAARAAHAARPPHAAADHPGRPRGVGASTPGTASRLPERRAGGPGRAAAPPARRRPGRPAEAGLRLRPALRVLRDPELPRRVRVAAAGGHPRRGRAGWPPTASASWCWSARTPRPTARTSATCGCSRRCCPQLAAVDGIDAGAAVLPAAGRDAARRWSRRSDARRASRRTSTCPSSTPAAGAAPDAAVRRRRALPRPARRGPRAARPTPASAPTSSSGSPARPRPTSPSSSGSSTRPGSTRSACSATPTRTAPRPRAARQGRPEATVADRVDRLVRAGRGAHRAARRGADRRAWSRCWSRRSTPTARPRAARRTRRRRSTARSSLLGAARAAGRRLVRATVVGTDGVDLVATVAVGATSWRASRRRGSSATAVTQDHLARRRPPAGSALVNIANGLTAAAAAAGAGLPRGCCSHEDGHDDGWRWSRPGASSRSPRSPTASTASWPAGAAWSPSSARSPTRSRTRR